MTVVALFDTEASVAAQVQGATSFARARQCDLVVLLPPASGGRSREAVQAQARGAVRAAGVFELHGDADVAAAPAEPPADGAVRRACRIEHVAAVDAASVRRFAPELLVVFRQRLDPRDTGAAAIAEALLPNMSCAVAVVRIGAEPHAGPLHVLVPMTRGEASRRALRLARELARGDGDRVTTVYVQPDIGRDAEAVGRELLGRLLVGALGDDREGVVRRVVVDDDVERGLATAHTTFAPDLVLVGVARAGLLTERFHGQRIGRLCRRLGDAPIVVLRGALPLGNRARRAIRRTLERFVPQLDRDTRVDLAARVQSSSAWNFDFVALISLATLIAALGLVQDSAAVIIGAMLVAPLMTPILGLGLAMTQGNTALGWMAVRAIGLGVGTAVGLGCVVGLFVADAEPTGEMWRRGWPGLSDLFVAFVSGLAAAYANSRPGLVAALPGVAIAASLVPPLATSGLAASSGHWELSYGAFLLFFTNMVAIVLASGASLWAVGVRSASGEFGWLKNLARALVVVVLVLAVHLSQRVHVGGAVPVPSALFDQVGAALPPGSRLVSVAAVQDRNEVSVTVRLAGRDPPSAALLEQLQPKVAAAFPGEVRLRIVHEWELSSVPR